MLSFQKIADTKVIRDDLTDLPEDLFVVFNIFVPGVRGAVLVQRDRRQGLRARQGQQLGAQLHQVEQRQLHRLRGHGRRRPLRPLLGQPVAQVRTEGYPFLPAAKQAGQWTGRKHEYYWKRWRLN